MHSIASCKEAIHNCLVLLSHSSFFFRGLARTFAATPPGVVQFRVRLFSFRVSFLLFLDCTRSKYAVRPTWGGNHHSGSSGMPVGSPGDSAAVFFVRSFVSDGR